MSISKLISTIESANSNSSRQPQGRGRLKKIGMVVHPWMITPRYYSLLVINREHPYE